MKLYPISAVIATRNRADALRRTMETLLQGSALPEEIILVDASEDTRSAEVLRLAQSQGGFSLKSLVAEVAGAAPQRTQGLQHASFDYILFLDDDILLEEDTIKRLFDAIEGDSNLGGVNAMITNQHYSSPGKFTSLLFRLLHGQSLESYAGRCIGPAKNILPEDRDDLPDVNAVDWLNTTCTLYRRSALPSPLFSDFFHGASFGEDLALSLIVARNWKLANVRNARIFHDSQPGQHKDNQIAHSEMELVNRHYIMTTILGKRGLKDYGKLLVLSLFETLASARTGGGHVPSRLLGNVKAWKKILTS